MKPDSEPPDPVKAHLQPLADSVPSLLSYIDLEERYLFVNAAYERWFGRPRSAFIGRRISEIQPPEAYAQAAPHISRALAGERVEFRMELDVPGRGRQVVLARMIPDRDEQDEVKGAFAQITDVTDITRAEEQYRRVVDSTIAGLYIHNVESGVNDFVNARYTEITGYSAAEACRLGREEFFQLFHPDDQPAIARHVERVRNELADGESLEIEYRFRTADGRWIWLYSSEAVFLRSDDGTALKILGTFVDVTARRNAEEIARAGRESLELALTAGKMGMWDWDMTNDQVIWSDGLFRLLGLDPAVEKADHDLWLQRLDPDVRERVEGAMATALERREDFNAEYPLTWPDGSRHWVEARGRYSYDAAGKAVQMHGVLTGIDERKQVEDSRQRFAHAIAHSPDAINLTDLEGRITFCNDASARLYGYTSVEELLGCHVRELNADPVRSTGVIIPAVHRDGGWTGVVHQCRKDGSEFSAFLSASLIRDEQGRPIGMMGNVRDVTDRHRAERQSQSFAALGRLLGACRTVRDAALTIVNTADELIGWDSCSLDLYSPETDLVHPVMTQDVIDGHRQECPPAYADCPPSELLRRVIDEEARLILRREPLEPEAGAVAFGDTDRRSASLMFAPIRHNGRVVGVLSIHSYEVDAYAPHDLKVLESLADHAAGALSRIGAEEALRQSEEMFRMAFNQQFQFMAILSPKGVVREINDLPLRAQGAERSDYIGELFWETPAWKTLPDEREKIRRQVRQAAESRQPIIAEDRYATATGEIRFAHAAYTGARDADGQLTAVLVQATDITESKQAEQALRESEARFRSLAENTRAVPWVVDVATDCFTFVGAQCREVFGFAPEEWYVPGFWERQIHDDDRDWAPAKCRTESQQSTDFEFEYRMRARDGEIVWVHDIVHVTKENGRPVQLSGFLIDVTEARQREQQYLRAQRMDAVGLLAGGMAHDLNNVLTPVTMSLDLLREDLPAEERNEIIDQLVANCERGAGIIRQVLTFARGADGARAPIDLGHLMSDMVKLAEETFPRNIKVTQRIRADLWPVLGDSTQIHQVLLNLCVNARDALERGGDLSLSARNQEFNEPLRSLGEEIPSGRYVQLTVADNGCGMSAEIRAKIFEPFFTTKDVGKGTGLGLPASLGIVKSHGGLIDVESELGSGTHVHLYLPATAAKEPQTAAEQKPAMPRGAGETVLLVDDEDTIQATTARALERFGYQVILADNGKQALAAYEREADRIDLVFTDIMMPEMDGLDLVRELRRRDPNLKILVCTGFAVAAEADHQERLAALGIDSVLKKPYSIQVVLQRIAEVLGG